MCGIAGFFFSKDQTHVLDASLHQLEEASRRMSLRGPDDAGIYQKKNVGLAHRRLAIIDLEGGKQPLTDPESGLTIIFNGEIYNYRQLRRQLVELGYTCTSHSDTETLLLAFRHWGRDCLQHIKGMYAFAIYNPKDHSLFLARDRLGVKPLFWTKQDKGIFFASSMAAILAFCEKMPDIDQDAVSHYLTTIRVNLGNRTLIKGVELLDPGNMLTVQPDGTVQQQTYWKPTIPCPQDKPETDIRTKQQNLYEMMDKAIERRLISDVPLGGFLSGGLDSAIIAARATELTNHRFHAYSVGYPEPQYNEFPFVRAAARHYNMRCEQISLSSQDYPQQWKQLIGLNGLPTTTPNEIPIWSLSKALRTEYTVALTGEGADEIFAGYTVPHFAGQDYERAAHDKNGAEQHAFALATQRAYGQPFIPSLAWQHLQLNHWLSPHEQQAWLHPDVWQNIQKEQAIEQFYQNLYSSYPQASTLDRIMAAHLRVNLEGLLLRVDSSSMAASVEARVPFTDHELVDFAFSLTDDDKVAWRSPQAETIGRNLNVLEIVQKDLLISKRILRETYHNVVPPSILQRPKMSFPVPIFEWMSHGMLPMIKETIADSPLRKTLFHNKTIENFLKAPETWHPMKIWPIVNLCLWHQMLSGMHQK